MLGALVPSERRGELLCIFERLLAGWGDRAIEEGGAFRSNVADDGGPFEFSMGFTPQQSEVQFYCEPLAKRPSLAGNTLLARELLSNLQDLGACLTRVKPVEELFLPQNPQGSFGLWLGCSWTQHRPPLFKVYFNPQICGIERSRDLVSRAMAAWGFERAWSTVMQHLSAESQRRDEISIVCLDLVKTADARVKVYVKHHGPSIADLEASVRLAADYDDRDVTTFYGALTAGREPFASRPPITELAFVDPKADRPSFATLEYPIGSYTRDDTEAQARVVRCLEAFGIDSRRYQLAFQAFSSGSAWTHQSLHSHVTLRRLSDGSPRIAVYFSSGVFARQKPGTRGIDPSTAEAE